MTRQTCIFVEPGLSFDETLREVSEDFEMRLASPSLLVASLLSHRTTTLTLQASSSDVLRLDDACRCRRRLCRGRRRVRWRVARVAVAGGVEAAEATEPLHQGIHAHKQRSALK